MKFLAPPHREPNEAEETVWNAVSEAFGEDQGYAFLGYPVYRQDGLLLHKPDILLFLRRYGVFLLECKGFRIHNIAQIEGTHWTMRNWHKDVEDPVGQAERQLFALKNLIERESNLATRVRFHARVCLPMVTSKEWVERGFRREGTTGNLLLKNDCSPTGLRAVVEAASSHYTQTPLNETEWATLHNRILQRPPPLGTGKRPRRYVYAEAPPSAELIAEQVGLSLKDQDGGGDPYTYVVATAALASKRVREGFGQLHQVNSNLNGGGSDASKPQLVFHQAIRALMGTPVLSRAEEHTLIARAAREVAAGNEAAAAALRHDVFSWRDALISLDEHGYDLREHLPEEVESRVVHPEVGRVLQVLQREYRMLQQDEQKRPFEAAARTFLEKAFRPTPLVIMEGFSRLTPLQRLFLDRCCQLGADVFLIHPYNSEQELGFEAIADTYRDWWNDVPVTLDSLPFAASGRLALLKTGLFGHAVSQSAPCDDSVTIASFAHRNREVAACIKRVRAYLQDGRERQDIAIVTRDPAAYRPMLLEESELQGVGDLFAIPPRNLLLTPLGQFLLTLYQIWQDNALDLSAEAFEAVLGSGWRGSKAQQSADAFAATAPQLFARCRTFADWVDALDQLRRASLREESRLPSASVEVPAMPNLWLRVLREVTNLCQQLFNAGNRSISGHIRVLLDQLEQLDPQRIRKAEQELLTRIEEVLQPQADGSSIEMSTAEFGSILARLGREALDEDATENQKQIAVTTPEGIDGTERPIVIFLGVDDRRIPRGYCDPWPLYEDQLDAHRAQERYLFLAVARAATHHLHYSFPLLAEGEACRPSPYLEDVCRLLQVQPTEDVVEPLAPSDPPAPERRANGYLSRPRYDLSEIAQFLICPYRYQLERLDPKARRYHMPWQMGFVAKATWMTHLLEYLSRRGEQAENPDEFLKVCLEYADKTEERVRAYFRGLRDLEWLMVRRNLEESLEYHRNRFADRFPAYPVRIEKPSHASFELELYDTHVTVTASTRYAFRVGRFRYSIIDEIRDEEWLRYGKKPREDVSPMESVAGLELFPDLYSAMKWWSDGMQAAFDHAEGKPYAAESYNRFTEDLERRLPAVQSGLYPKHPGEQCRYCPVHNECLGRNP